MKVKVDSAGSLITGYKYRFSETGSLGVRKTMSLCYNYGGGKYQPNEKVAKLYIYVRYICKGVAKPTH
jgi:hypothetical protein